LIIFVFASVLTGHQGSNQNDSKEKLFHGVLNLVIGDKMGINRTELCSSELNPMRPIDASSKLKNKS
jgi:hypothetical protein